MASEVIVDLCRCSSDFLLDGDELVVRCSVVKRGSSAQTDLQFFLWKVPAQSQTAGCGGLALC